MKPLNFKQLVYCFTAFAIALCAFRIFKTNQFSYFFLIWNLFLALIPWWISEYLKTRHKLQLKHIPMVFAWLLFLPNAPYILTDLFHLRQRADIPLWFDLVLILSFAFAGLIVFMKSLKDMLLIFRHYLSPFYHRVFTFVVFWLISFGLYLGRYVRFNSWDVIHPVGFMKTCVRLFIHEQSLKEVSAFTCVFSAFLMMVFFVINHTSGEGKETAKYQ